MNIEKLIDECEPEDVLDLVMQLKNSGETIEEYIPNLINKCTPNDIVDLTGVFVSLEKNIENNLVDLIDKCAQKDILYLVRELKSSKIRLDNNVTNLVNKCNEDEISVLVRELNYSEVNLENFMIDLIDKCTPKKIPSLIEELKNSEVKIQNYLMDLIDKCDSEYIEDLVISLKCSKTNLESYGKDIINKCEPHNISNLARELKCSRIYIENYAMDLINRCSSQYIQDLVKELSYSRINLENYVVDLINKCDLDYISKLIENLNYAGIYLNENIKIELAEKITNIKKLKPIILTKFSINNIDRFEEKLDDMIKKIKKLNLSTKDVIQIKYFNGLIKNISNINDTQQLLDICNVIKYINPTILADTDNRIMKTFYKKILDIDIDEEKVLNNKLDKDIRFGIEIESLGLTKEYIQKLEIQRFKIKEDISIQKYDKETEKVEENPNKDKAIDDSAEVISDIMDPYSEDDMSNIYQTCKKLRNNGADTNFTCGLHVHVSGDDIDIHNPKVLDDLTYDMVFMQDLLIEKMNIYFNRLDYYTQKVPQSVCGDSIAFIKEFDKYYMLNLQSIMTHGTVEFRLFNLPDTIDENLVIAYADMATSMVNSVRKHGSYGKKIQQAFYNLQDDGLSAEEVNEVVYEEFLNYIDVTPKTKKILTQMDKIFDFYEAKEPKIDGKQIDFYTKNNIKKEIKIENKKEQMEFGLAK